MIVSSIIRSFADKETERLFNREHSFKLPTDIQKRARIRLAALNAATTINDLHEPPSNHLEALKGNRKGQYSIHINQQWRVCFRFEDGHAFEVEIVDYH